MLDALGLFDTLVPAASVVTVFCIVVFLMPRNEYLGLYFLVWWTTAVVISLQSSQDDVAELRPWNEGSNDALALLVIFSVPCLFAGTLFAWSSRDASVRHVLCHGVPHWALVALHVYRLDGCSLVLSTSSSTSASSAYRSTWLAYQMLVLDVTIGALSLPVSYMLYRNSSRFYRYSTATTNAAAPAPFSSKRRSSRRYRMRAANLFLAWNALGLYDIVSAYVILLCNYLGVGGPSIVDPPLTAITVHPLPLLLLFQVPLALMVHIRFLCVHGGGLLLFGSTSSNSRSVLPM